MDDEKIHYFFKLKMQADLLREHYNDLMSIIHRQTICDMFKFNGLRNNRLEISSVLH